MAAAHLMFSPKVVCTSWPRGVTCTPVVAAATCTVRNACDRLRLQLKKNSEFTFKSLHLQSKESPCDFN